jgi:hypothetical protein
MTKTAASFRTRLAVNQSGLALLEFALSLPIILTMGLSGVELAHMALTTERVNQIAMLTADNAARVRDTIDERDVNQIMIGAKYVGASIKFAQNGRVILSSVQNNPGNTGQWIRWQRCTGAKNVSSSYGVEGKGWNDSSLSAGVGPTGNKVTAAAGTSVMFVEVVYDYQPIVPIDYFGAKTMRVIQGFNVRQRNPASSTIATGTPPVQVIDPAPPADLKNAKALTGANISSCALYSA